MHSQVVILSGGHETDLLKIRNEVLKISGYTVVSAHTAPDLIEKFHAGDFDLVLLCHSFSTEEQAEIAREIHAQSPSTPVLVLASGNRVSTAADSAVPNDPRSLLKAITGATNQRFQAPPRREQAS